MVLVVEDGSMVTGANSYVSLEDANLFVSNQGGDATWEALSDDEKSIRLYNAQRYLTQKYSSKFVGFFVNNEQPLDWPRNNAVKKNGRTISNDSVPQEVKDTQIEIALKWTVDSENFYPVGANNIKRIYEKVGQLTSETEYFSGGISQEVITKIGLTLDNVLHSSNFVLRV